MKDSKSIVSLLTSMGFNVFTKHEDNNNDYAPIRLQKRLDVDVEFSHVPLCECNDKLHINVYVSDYVISQHECKSITFEIIAKNKDSEWVELDIYGLDFDKLNSKDDVLKYCLKLVKAWTAIYS